MHWLDLTQFNWKPRCGQCEFLKSKRKTS